MSSETVLRASVFTVASNRGPTVRRCLPVYSVQSRHFRTLPSCKLVKLCGATLKARPVAVHLERQLRPYLYNRQAQVVEQQHCHTCGCAHCKPTTPELSSIITRGQALGYQISPMSFASETSHLQKDLTATQPLQLP